VWGGGLVTSDGSSVVNIRDVEADLGSWHPVANSAKS
jgi:hypothetical protein